MMWRFTRAALAALALAGAVWQPLIAQRGPLPEFTLRAADAGELTAASLAKEGKWLLVFVGPRCAPCDRLLAEIDRDERPLADRIVVIGSGMAEEAVADLSKRHPNLAGSAWFADPQRAAAHAAGARTAPMVLGMDGSQVEWRLTGALQSGRDLESILFSWLEKK